MGVLGAIMRADGITLRERWLAGARLPTRGRKRERLLLVARSDAPVQTGSWSSEEAMYLAQPCELAARHASHLPGSLHACGTKAVFTSRRFLARLSGGVQKPT